MLPNLFIKGHLRIQVDNRVVEHIHQSVSLFGVSGLPWGTLEPSTHFGKIAQITLRIPQATRTEDETFQLTALILSEQTTRSKYLVLRFELTPEQKSRLRALIDRFGHFPEEFIRKYPRIPMDEALRVYPTRALITRPTKNESLQAAEESTIVTDVRNLSPSGVLLSTENPNASSLSPGMHLLINFEPRGWFREPLKVSGQLCRIMDEITPKTRQSIRYLGVKFTHLNAENKQMLQERLKDILLQLKSMN